MAELFAVLANDRSSLITRVPIDYAGGAGVILGELLDSVLGQAVEIVPEDPSAYFCPELVAQALEEAKTVSPVNASQ